ncbi:MAG: multidrug ABC transporter permease [Zetaproteobacteria bacterium]|nr:MAG: multidrug ABC transporter permease [Zetaproteobacteria bacterium]
MINQFPCERKIKGINKIGLWTLIKREVLRFLNVYTQTIIAPMVTTLMFYTVFSLAFGGVNREINGISFLAFLAPGLIMMTMVQNAFANTSSSLVISKVQGNIVDVLMPPLSAMEIYTGYAVGAVVRGLTVGLCTTIALSIFAPIQIYSWSAILTFAFLGTLMLGNLGIAAGIWSDRFDHIAAVTNFVVTPMTFLSGTFYNIDVLPDIWQNIARFNPFFYMIDGFRYGFIGQADGSIIIGVILLSLCNIGLISLSYWMIKTGYKIKS